MQIYAKLFYTDNNGKNQEYTPSMFFNGTGLPTSLGQKTMSASTSVTFASDQSPLTTIDAYSTADIDEVSASLTYVGKVQTGTTNWIIQKITISGTVTSMRSISGTTGYATNWTNRASLTYTI